MDSLCPGEGLKIIVNMKMIAIDDEQLEMAFSGTPDCRPRVQRRLTRAQWWFHRMRQLVDHAVDWRPTPPPRPEQIWFPTVRRIQDSTPGVPADSAPQSEEHQMCE